MKNGRTIGSFRLPGGRRLKTTAVFDTYWRFACDRQAIYWQRVAGLNPPWTEDEILSSYRFTNPYRASDRVSQYLIQHVIYEGEQTATEVFFRTILFKLFNRIDTWELLKRELGAIDSASFAVARYDRVLSAAQDNGATLYSGAYIMPAPKLGHRRKHSNHIELLRHMLAVDLPDRIADARSLKEVFELLLSMPSIGRFLAFQFAIDLNYSDVLSFSEMDLVVAGPGARSGLRKAFVDDGGLSDEELIRAVTEHASREFSARGLVFQDLLGRSLQLIDCQNLFCEVDKYARIAHPDIGGSGRVRMKRKYEASDAAPVSQWFPPKWGVHRIASEPRIPGA